MKSSMFKLEDSQINQFHEDGLLLIKGFFDVKSEIEPIQRALYEIIGILIEKRGLDLKQPPFESESFDSSYLDLIAEDRSLGGEIYDAAKLIPDFLRLISSEKSEALFRQLRGSDLAGIGAASYGIRIDPPFEEQFRSHWHQEFLAQPQSIDGVVFWTPLMKIKENMGPVIICRESHKDGLRKVTKHGLHSGKSGAYQIGLVDEEQVTSSYEQIAPLTSPGDLVIMDFLTIHQSGYNVSDRARWSVQSRFFNFRERNGIKIGWKPSVTAGTDIEDVFSDYFE